MSFFPCRPSFATISLSFLLCTQMLTEQRVIYCPTCNCTEMTGQTEHAIIQVSRASFLCLFPVKPRDKTLKWFMLKSCLFGNLLAGDAARTCTMGMIRTNVVEPTELQKKNHMYKLELSSKLVQSLSSCLHWHHLLTPPQHPFRSATAQNKQPHCWTVCFIVSNLAETRNQERPIAQNLTAKATKGDVEQHTIGFDKWKTRGGWKTGIIIWLVCFHSWLEEKANEPCLLICFHFF